MEIKSIAELIDQLITTNIKCYMAQERLQRLYDSGDKEEAAEAAIVAQRLNARRNELMQAIDARLGESSITPTGKTYG